MRPFGPSWVKGGFNIRSKIARKRYAKPRSLNIPKPQIAGVQRGTDEIMAQDNAMSNRALSGTISACEGLKNRVEQVPKP